MDVSKHDSYPRASHPVSDTLSPADIHSLTVWIAMIAPLLSSACSRSHDRTTG
jgi:hypothetical protein